MNLKVEFVLSYDNFTSSVDVGVLKLLSVKTFRLGAASARDLARGTPRRAEGTIGAQHDCRAPSLRFEVAVDRGRRVVCSVNVCRVVCVWAGAGRGSPAEPQPRPPHRR